MMDMYAIVSVLLAAMVLWGIRLMSSPKTAVMGNRLGGLSMLAAIVLVLYTNGIMSVPLLWAAMLVGSVIGIIIAVKATMIKMPQLVALLNGLGGGASALVALVEAFERPESRTLFSRITGQLALSVGAVTLAGSLIAAAKLDRRISQRPVLLPSHQLISRVSIAGAVVLMAVASVKSGSAIAAASIGVLVLSLWYGVVFALRVGGADMPVTISLLNSLSGVAGAICGFTIGEPLLVAVGAVVGASGLILTRIMCTAMNRSLVDVLRGSAAIPPAPRPAASAETSGQRQAAPTAERAPKAPPARPADEVLREAKKVIIVPGYGMAISQAQSEVKRLLDVLEAQGKEVDFAIHPVAGRMPGHMNVLLAEVDVPYEKMREMDDVNPEFAGADVGIVIGACDVVNPAATSAEGTPIYGMPVLKIEDAKHVLVFNLDKKPGYSGVDNPLYDMPNVDLVLGNAKETLAKVVDDLAARG